MDVVAVEVEGEGEEVQIGVQRVDPKVDEMLSSRTSAGVRRLQEKLSKQLYWQL